MAFPKVIQTTSKAWKLQVRKTCHPHAYIWQTPTTNIFVCKFPFFSCKCVKKKWASILNNMFKNFVHLFTYLFDCLRCCAGFPLVSESGLFSSCSARAPCCSGCSCGAQAPGCASLRSCNTWAHNCSSCDLLHRCSSCGALASLLCCIKYFNSIFNLQIYLEHLSMPSCIFFFIFFLKWMHNNLELECTIVYLTKNLQFSRSVVSDSLRPHEPQHATPPCPPPTPGVYSNPCPSSQWCHLTISSSVIPFSSLLQSFPAPGSSHQVAKVLEFQLQHQSFQWTPRIDLL